MSNAQQNPTKQLAKLDWFAFAAFLTLIAFAFCTINRDRLILILAVVIGTFFASLAGYKLFGINGSITGIILGSTVGATIATGLPLLTLAAAITATFTSNKLNGWIWATRISLYGAVLIYSSLAVLVALGILGLSFGPQA